MGESWESCLVRSRLSLLMSWMTSDSSRSGCSGIINDQQRGVLTDFYLCYCAVIKHPKPTESPLWLYVDTTVLNTPVRIFRSHIPALTQIHSRLSKDKVFNLIDELVMCAVSQSAVSQPNKRLFQGNNVLSVGRIKLNELNAVLFTAAHKHNTDRQQLSPLDMVLELHTYRALSS